MNIEPSLKDNPLMVELFIFRRVEYLEILEAKIILNMLIRMAHNHSWKPSRMKYCMSDNWDSKMIKQYSRRFECLKEI